MSRQVEVDPRFGVLLVVMGGVLFTLAGLVLLAYLVYARRMASHSAGWPTTEGEVIRSKPYTYSVGSVTAHDARVTYRYWVDGRKYVSSQVTFEPFGFASRVEASEVASRFPPGGRVTVYYDPRKAGRAVLLPGPRPTHAQQGGFILVAAFVLIVGLYFLHLVR